MYASHKHPQRIGLFCSTVVSKLRLARKRPSLGKDDGPQDSKQVTPALPLLKLAFQFWGVKELSYKNSDLPHLCVNAVSNCPLKSSFTGAPETSLDATLPGRDDSLGHVPCNLPILFSV